MSNAETNFYSDTQTRPSRASCERFYFDYGAGSNTRAPKYIDLPECTQAHEHRQSRRRRDAAPDA